MPEYDDETSTESETEALVDIETVPDNNNSMESVSPSDAPDINLEQSSINEEITAMPTIVSMKADDNKMENASSLDASSTGESNAANATITLLKYEAVSADSNNVEGISSLAKTTIGLGIGFIAVVALISLKKRQQRSLN